MANPGHREGQAILIAAFGDEVEIVVRVDNVFGPAGVGGISVEDAAVLVLIEDGDSWRFRTGEFDEIEVVLYFAFCHFLRCEGSAEVVVEVCPERRDPGKSPAHALLERLNFGQRSSGNRCKRDIALR